MALTLFHTADVHIARFDAIRDRIAPHVELCHINRPDWLSRARQGDATVDAECLTAFAIAGPALCSCTTLGPLADQAGIVRIDRPMMQQAAETAGNILLAYCVDSTAEASRALLNECIGNRPVRVTTLPILEAWPLFEGGDNAGYAAKIAHRIREHAAGHDCILLGQASMDVAAPLLADLPIMTPAETAFIAALDRSRASR